MSLRTILFVVVAVLLVLIAYRLFVPFQPTVSETMPAHLHGTWITTDLHYSDHYVEIEAESVVFGTGGVTGRRYRVTGFDQSYLENGQLVDTMYLRGGDGSRTSRQFTFAPENGGQLVFLNRPGVIWIRQRTPAAPTPAS
jgi:hypothetical protein